jgi:hypothetical protein
MARCNILKLVAQRILVHNMVVPESLSYVLNFNFILVLIMTLEDDISKRNEF